MRGIFKRRRVKDEGRGEGVRLVRVTLHQNSLKGFLSEVTKRP